MKARLYDELKQKAYMNSRDASLAPGTRAFWSRMLGEMQAGEKAALSKNYAMLGIYDNGEPVIPEDFRDCFLDCTADLAFVLSIEGPPECTDLGLRLWPYEKIRYDVLSIDDLLAWQLLHANGWLDWKKRYENDDGPLRWALMCPRIREPKIWDCLYALFPDERLEDMFWKAPTIEAVRWLDQEPHKADRHYAGLSCGMEKAVASRRWPDTPKILEYLYGTETEETDGET